MSTLKVNNIGKTSGTTQDTMEGLAKAWANLNGTGTIALRDSFNVSSVTDEATGRYTFNMASAMANSNYCVVAMKQNDVSNVDFGYIEAIVDRTASSILMTSIESDTATDSPNANHAIFGDLA